MADIVDAATRSRMMSSIRATDTQPERIVRSLLHGQGLRFRLRSRSVPGKPDLVLPKWNAVIFVHGCFWHRHKGCRLASSPASNSTFWQDKFTRNVARDAEVEALLKQAGWRVAVVWECALGTAERQSAAIHRLSRWIRSRRRRLVIG